MSDLFGNHIVGFPTRRLKKKKKKKEKKKKKAEQGPIVVKLHQYTDRELVRKTEADKSEQLKRLNQGVGVQHTKSVLQKRRDLSAYDR